MSNQSETLKCSGRRRYGGAFTLGPMRWEDCPDKPSVVLVLADGREEPACTRCWKECVENKISISEVKPL